MVSEPRPRLLMRQNCHLCEQAAQELAEAGVEFDSFDVDTDADLAVIYGDLIPVLLLGSTEVARAPINGLEVATRLNLLHQLQKRQ